MTMRRFPAPHRRTVAVATAAIAAVTLAACIQPAKPPHTPGAPPPTPGPGARALRFFGTGSGQVDRVEIPLNGKANVGAGDFTVEVWLRGALGDNGAGNSCSTGEAAWINGNIFIDRDVFGGGDYGDYGLSLYAGRVAFGASSASNGDTICGSRNVLDGAWHHIAVTRQASTGRLQLYVDGQLDAQAATSPATGNISYRVGRGTSYPGSDPFLVLAAEKHDAGSSFPSFNGYLDELRLSTVIRYSGNFTRPGGPFSPDGSTAALYHFNEGAGTTPRRRRRDQSRPDQRRRAQQRSPLDRRPVLEATTGRHARSRRREHHEQARTTVYPTAPPSWRPPP